MSKNLEIPEFIKECVKGHELQGAVKYCPFCGTPVAKQHLQPTLQQKPASVPIIPRPSPATIVAEVAKISVPEQKPVTIENPVNTPEVVPTPISDESSKRPVGGNSSSRSASPFKWLKYTIGIVVLFIVVGGAIFVYEKFKPVVSYIPSDSGTETAIRVAIEEMQSTGKSLFNEKQTLITLNNAREALAQSESYRETVNQLEIANTNTLRKTKEHLSAYLAQVARLSQNSGQSSSAIDAYAITNQNNAFMVALLKQHVTSYSLNKDMSEDAWKLELEPVSLQLGL